VDRLPVDESTPEEYCWLLRDQTGEYAFGATAARSASCIPWSSQAGGGAQ
jgi:hypothetical protein